VRLSASEVALSAGVLAVGIAAGAITAALPSEGGYSGIGPNFVPGLVSAGMIALGAWLLYEALTGGWRNTTPHTDAFQGRRFMWVSAGLFAHMALIASAGFVIAGAVLFAFVARAFASRRILRDFAIGLALALVVYVFFTQVLNVNLPAGWTPFRH
jgi:putative tricarboxylic transport membrane protein